MRRRQKGFLLNPYRFAGTTQSGALSVTGESTPTLAGASVISMALSSIAEASMMAESGLAVSGAFSSVAESIATLAGASRANGSVSAQGESATTFSAAADVATVDAAYFDGADNLTRAGLTGAADSKSGILSFWVYSESSHLASPVCGAQDTEQFQTRIFFDNGTTKYRCRVVNTTNLDYVAQMNGDSAIGTSAWHHVLFSWDGAAAAAHLYLDDVNDLAGTSTTTDVNGDYTLAAWAIGCRLTPAFSPPDQFLTGGLAEVYVALGQYLDFSVEENRRKFRSATGKPVQLGATGSIPTGTAPTIYLHLDEGETANNFAINRGTGGNFTVTGALGTYPTSPSD